MKKLLAIILSFCLLLGLSAVAEPAPGQEAFFRNLFAHLSGVDYNGHQLSLTCDALDDFQAVFQQHSDLASFKVNYMGTEAEVQLGSTGVWVSADGQVFELPYDELAAFIAPYLQMMNTRFDTSVYEEILALAAERLVMPYVTVEQKEDGTQVITYKANLNELIAAFAGFVDEVVGNETYVNAISAPFSFFAAMEAGSAENPVDSFIAEWPQLKQTMLETQVEGDLEFVISARNSEDGSAEAVADFKVTVGDETVTAHEEVTSTNEAVHMIETVSAPMYGDMVEVMNVTCDIDLVTGNFAFIAREYEGQGFTLTGTCYEDSLDARLTVRGDYAVETDLILSASWGEDRFSGTASVYSHEDYEMNTLRVSWTPDSFSADMMNDDYSFGLILQADASGNVSYARLTTGDMYDPTVVTLKDGVLTFQSEYETYSVWIVYESETRAVVNVDMLSKYSNEPEHGEIRLDIVDVSDGWKLVGTVIDTDGETVIGTATLACEPASGIEPLSGKNPLTITADMIQSTLGMLGQEAGLVSQEAEMAIDGHEA